MPFTQQRNNNYTKKNKTKPSNLKDEMESKKAVARKKW